MGISGFMHKNRVIVNMQEFHYLLDQKLSVIFAPCALQKRLSVWMNDPLFYQLSLIRCCNMTLSQTQRYCRLGLVCAGTGLQCLWWHLVLCFLPAFLLTQFSSKLCLLFPSSASQLAVIDVALMAHLAQLVDLSMQLLITKHTYSI